MPPYNYYVVRDGALKPRSRGVVRDGAVKPVNGGASAPPPDPGGGGGGAAPDPAIWGSAPVLHETFANLNRWNIRTGTVSNNLARYRTANVVTTVSDGLQITSQPNPTDAANPYWSGDIQTYSLSGQPTKWTTPGNNWRMEFVAKVPLEPGFWAAPLWLRGLRNGGTVDGLEIDLLETYAGHAPDFQVTGTLHYRPYGTGHSHVTRKKAYSTLPNPNARDYHRYVMEKKPGETKLWCDDVLVGTWNAGNTPDYGTFFDVASTVWALRSCVQIDATSASVASGTPGPGNDWSAAATTMFVKYVKVWDYVV